MVSTLEILRKIGHIFKALNTTTEFFTNISNIINKQVGRLKDTKSNIQALYQVQQRSKSFMSAIEDLSSFQSRVSPFFAAIVNVVKFLARFNDLEITRLQTLYQTKS